MLPWLGATAAFAHPSDELTIALTAGEGDSLEVQATLSPQVLDYLGAVPRAEEDDESVFARDQEERIARYLGDHLEVSSWGRPCPRVRDYAFAPLLRPLNGFVFHAAYECSSLDKTLKVVGSFFRETAEGFETNVFVSSPSGSFVARFPKGQGEFVSGMGSRAKTWLQYASLGFEHILAGFDHLVFLLVLVFSSYVGTARLDAQLSTARRLRAIALNISAFTIAHGVVLLYALHWKVTIPGDIVEPAIALSICVAAAVPLVRKGRELGVRGTVIGDSLFTFAVGLVHGLGFAGSLEDIGLPQQYFLGAIASFNLGIELGQALFVSSILAALLLAPLLRVGAPVTRRVSVLVLASSFGVALYWFIERVLSAFAGSVNRLPS